MWSSLLETWTPVLAPYTPHPTNTYICEVTIAPKVCDSNNEDNCWTNSKVIMTLITIIIINNDEDNFDLPTILLLFSQYSTKKKTILLLIQLGHDVVNMIKTIIILLLKKNNYNSMPWIDGLNEKLERIWWALTQEELRLRWWAQLSP